MQLWGDSPLAGSDEIALASSSLPLALFPVAVIGPPWALTPPHISLKLSWSFRWKPWARWPPHPTLGLAFQIRTKWIPLVNGGTERGPR